MKHPSIQLLPRPQIGTWRSRAAASPWGVTFGPEIENPCENHILWAFRILWRKFFCFSFFGLCFVKNGHLCQFSGKSYFDQTNERYCKKYSRIPVSTVFWTTFVGSYDSFWQKQDFTENWQIWPFFTKKVQKMSNKNFFFIKYKMLTVYGFHVDFQFRAQKWLPRDL